MFSTQFSQPHLYGVVIIPITKEKTETKRDNCPNSKVSVLFSTQTASLKERCEVEAERRGMTKCRVRELLSRLLFEFTSKLSVLKLQVSHLPEPLEKVS